MVEANEEKNKLPKVSSVGGSRGFPRCSDRIHKNRTHPRVLQLSNCIFKASELCKWLRHSHMTASMPSFGTGCVICGISVT
ncbi:unnamed protein product [Malus baccata var. baccata]